MILIFFIIGYFLPWIIAKLRHKANSDAILIFNLLLGWMVIGWIAALVWAFLKD
jgi:hypothetical protein